MLNASFIPAKDYSHYMADLKISGWAIIFWIGYISPRTEETAKVAEQKLLKTIDLGGVAVFSERNSKIFFFQKVLKF